MAGNSFGHSFRLTTFGESHGAAIGGIIDGCPSGYKLDIDAIQADLNRRRPGQSAITTQRKEPDAVEFLSGIMDGVTLGTPIGFIIKNKDQRSKDYDHIQEAYRPSHADYTYDQKYGVSDRRGGGRSSARETACRVVAGSIAAQILAASGIHITAWVSAVGELRMNGSGFSREEIDQNEVRCPDQKMAGQMIELIKEIKKSGDTIGGQVTCSISGCPVGLGEPVFDRLNADLAKAMFSINAVKGFELGSGFGSMAMKGSAHNDPFILKGNQVGTTTNHSGGIQGGISNGEEIYFNVAFKPVATIVQKQQSLDKSFKPAEVEGKGRHDPCVVPRAVPIVEAMAALVLLDHLMRQQSVRIK